MTEIRKAGASSSSVAIGTASVFVLAAACVSLLVDGGSTGPARLGSGWTLRGTFAPLPHDLAPAERHAAVQLPAAFT